jgi:hypothetical protein
MVIETQLSLLEPYDEMTALRKHVIEETESNRKKTKKLFALNAELKSELVLELTLMKGDIAWLKTLLNKKTEIVDFHLQKQA